MTFMKRIDPSLLMTRAVVFNNPQEVVLDRLPISAPGDDDVIVDIDFSGISTGTEKLLWDGTMPKFPGMGYPLVPGYESIGRVIAAGSNQEQLVGERVFVPGATCYGEVKGLFGGASSRITIPAVRVTALHSDELADDARSDAYLDVLVAARPTLLALAATAHHMLVVAGLDAISPHIKSGSDSKSDAPSHLIVGHGVLGRLLARILVAKGFASPRVWEINEARTNGALGYQVSNPNDDPKRNYQKIWDVSGDSQIIDQLVGRLAPSGMIILGGFYNQALNFAFAPAFMREAQIRIAAQWQPADLIAVTDLLATNRLSLAGLITHQTEPSKAADAYRTAFGDTSCLKMILDWRHCS